MDSRPGPLAVLDLPAASLQDRRSRAGTEARQNILQARPQDAVLFLLLQHTRRKPVLDCLTSSCHGHVVAGHVPLDAEAVEVSDGPRVHDEHCMSHVEAVGLKKGRLFLYKSFSPTHY